MQRKRGRHRKRDRESLTFRRTAGGRDSKSSADMSEIGRGLKVGRRCNIFIYQHKHFVCVYMNINISIYRGEEGRNF